MKSPFEAGTMEAQWDGNKREDMSHMRERTRAILHLDLDAFFM